VGKKPKAKAKKDGGIKVCSKKQWQALNPPRGNDESDASSRLNGVMRAVPPGGTNGAAREAPRREESRKLLKKKNRNSRQKKDDPDINPEIKKKESNVR